MRAARAKSESGCYHVVAWGNGRQIIFESDADRTRFLHLLQERAGATGVSVIAWCLMDNHVHLILEDCANRLSEFMHVLLTRYAAYFNSRSGHVGHVFQERFFSEPIESDRHLLAAVRYVHLNPERAGISGAESYAWSSFGEYVGRQGAAALSRTQTVLDIVQGAKGFRRLCEADAEPGLPMTCRCDEEGELLSIANGILRDAGMGEASEVGGLPRERRDDALRLLRRAGFSIRRIERMTGVGRGTVHRVTGTGERGAES